MSAPSLAALLNKVRESTFAGLRVSCPGRVERYDAAKQTVDVKLLVQDFYEDAGGVRRYVSEPVISNVPVQFPGGGGMRITLPIAAGDPVLVVFADRSIDQWQATGNEGTPEDTRRHHISDAFAIPGIKANPQAWTDAPTDVISIGQDAAAAEFVATAQRVLTELQKIQTTFNAHVHTGVTTGPGSSGPPATPLSGLVAPASATVKIKG